MIDFLKLVKSRRSIRRFSGEKIPKEILRNILEATKYTPSAGNLQSWKCYIITDQKKKEAIAKACYKQMFIQQAPLVFVVFSLPSKSKTRYGKRGELYSIIDASIAATYILLSSHSLGLGVVYIGAFEDDKIRNVINVPLHEQPIAVIPVGYPAENPMPTEKASIEQLFQYV